LETLINIAKWNSYNNPLEKVCGGNSIIPSLLARGQDNNAQMVLICEELQNTTNLKKAVLEMEKHIRIKTATAKGYDEAYDGDSINLAFPDSNTRRGRVGKGISQTLDTHCNTGVCVSEPEIRKSEKVIVEDSGDDKSIKITEEDNLNKIIYEKPLDRKGWHNKACEVLNIDGLSTCIHTQSNNLLQKIKEHTLRIRKLTPKECWRLMGFDDEDFEKAEKVNSNAQLYKQAGNSIAVNVLVAIFKEMV